MARQGALRIEECFVSQHGLRNVAQLADMIRFVKDGGRFNKESLKPPGPIIHLVKFPTDGQIYIQDGHHRMCAMVMADRPFLFEDEYRIECWDYEQFEEINFECGWVTPYDPRVETRHPDYAGYKETVNQYLKVSQNHAVEFIARNRHLYCAQRKFYHIRAMIEKMHLDELLKEVHSPRPFQV